MQYFHRCADSWALGQRSGQEGLEKQKMLLVADTPMYCSDGGEGSYRMSVLQSQALVLWQGSLNTRKFWKTWEFLDNLTLGS